MGLIHVALPEARVSDHAPANSPQYQRRALVRNDPADPPRVTLR